MPCTRRLSVFLRMWAPRPIEIHFDRRQLGQSRMDWFMGVHAGYSFLELSVLSSGCSEDHVTVEILMRTNAVNFLMALIHLPGHTDCFLGLSRQFSGFHAMQFA